MSAPNLKEIEWAISELESQESSEKRYTLLAALYTCRNQLLGSVESIPRAAAYSASEEKKMEAHGSSDFLQAVAGKESAAVWKVLDELMETLYVVEPRMYNSVLRKIGRL